MLTSYTVSLSDYSVISSGKFKVLFTAFPAIGGMMVSSDTSLRYTTQEEKTCGECRKSGSSNDSPDSSETPTSEEGGSFTNPLLQQPETTEWNLPEKKKENHLHAKGGKTLPKKKHQQKTTLTTDHNVASRLLLATDHNIKELKSEVAVLRNKLETFTVENKILKRLQSQHLKAISKHKNAEINLPDLLATQTNEVLTLRSFLRTSQEKERRASNKLREVEAELLKTTDTLRALKKLSEEKKLEDREDLKRKLTSYTQKLEASDKRIQLAVAKKMTTEAQSSTANLQLEIESLKLKLKEKERELSITNIYARRMDKSQSEKADSCFSPKVVKVSKAIQVNISLKPRTLGKGEPEGSRMTFHEELKANIEPETGVHLPEILPVHNISNGTFMGLQSEEIESRIEENIQYEKRERQKSRRERQGLDLFEEEFNKLKAEPSFFPINHNLEVAMEKEENKADKEAKEAICKEVITAIPRHRLSTLKKHYVFTEASENLHQGYPSTGPLVKPRMPCSGRPRNRQQGELTHFWEDPVTNYEPSFAKFPNERPKDKTSTPGEETTPKIPPEKKRLLLEKLFGSNSIFSK
ncbi:lebercilin-like protein isoform X2 [Crotalus tigris]|uniref:lebercilin-like protein isoform X2 n=1 Tax=Crotalus tigris TaxID=88082 RepID=UPI00192F70F0|nr:lebercilin-like protein isoform X2 [Crotalus tigris]